MKDNTTNKSCLLDAYLIGDNIVSKLSRSIFFGMFSVIMCVATVLMCSFNIPNIVMILYVIQLISTQILMICGVIGLISFSIYFFNDDGVILSVLGAGVSVFVFLGYMFIGFGLPSTAYTAYYSPENTKCHIKTMSQREYLNCSRVEITDYIRTNKLLN